jgi:hypothetical protein
MIKRHVTRSCCRTKSYIFETSKPVRKSQIDIFKKAGYIAPPSFITAGVFYVRGNGITAQTSFGSKKINVKCSGHNCKASLDKFEKTLEKAVNS